MKTRTTPVSESTFPARCRTCQSELLSPLACAACQTVFPPESDLDFFIIFGLERGFELDPTRLDQRYRSVARVVHPDRFERGNPETSMAALRVSALVNRAYDTLKDPVRRIEYLLELCGGPAASEVRDVPASFLTEVMTLREELESAKATGTKSAMEEMHRKLAVRRRSVWADVEPSARRLTSSGPEDRRELRRMLNSLKYLDSLLMEASPDPLGLKESNPDA